MRIERINENKIRVVISREDTKHWNVNLKKFTENSPEAQELFWFVLKQAEQDVNFCVGRDRLMVETMDTGGDCFVMLISKINSGADIAEELLRRGKRVKQAEIRFNCRTKQPPSLYRIFKFEDFESLCCGAAEINEMFMGGSRLFKYEEAFYLELKPVDSFGFFEIENALTEFGKKCANPSVLCGILSEHGQTMISADAVTVLFGTFGHGR